MTKNNTTLKTYVNQVITLDIDKDGVVTQQLTELERTLDNTLLSRLFPGMKVAIVNLPQEFLDAFEESQVENAMTTIVYDGVPYRYVGGGSSSSKKKQFFFVEASYAPAIIKRLHHSPQNALRYFGILVSDCKVLIEDPNVRVMVVKDHVLGTNDSSGFVSRALFKDLQRTHHVDLQRKELDRLKLVWKGSLPEAEAGREPNDEEMHDFNQRAKAVADRNFLRSLRFYQFRLAFSGTQAKGAFKIMGNDVAEHLGADIVIPESAIKPSLDTPTENSEYGEIRRFRGPIVLGVRDFSRKLEFESSYTLIEHAPKESFELEIKPHAIEMVRKVNACLKGGKYKELLELLGHKDLENLEEDPELRVVEAALIADPTGEIVKHPHINNQLNRVLARWAIKTATGGGYRLPAFALAHDGYLVVHEGRIYAGSDWIPRDQAIAPLESKSGLFVRYPIRMIEDLLPLKHMSTEDLLVNLTAHLFMQDCPKSYELARRIVAQQLRLEGTSSLHSETAEDFCGDFDFDTMCVIEDVRLPLFVKKRLSITNPFYQEKNKAKKAASPWSNAEHVAVKAGNNRIGEITDLMTSCRAAGREDLARELVTELQNALDSLKHDVLPDREVIAAIKQEIGNAAPWLAYKKKERISDLPVHLDVLPTDRVGDLYNHVRKEIEDLLEAKLPIEEFKGLIVGEKFDREMFEECRFINQAYAAKVASTSERETELQAEVDKAQAAWNAFEQDPQKELRKQERLGKFKSQSVLSGLTQSQWALRKDPETALRKQLRSALSKAKSALYRWQKDRKEQMEGITSTIRVWASGKTENRMGWCQALHRVVSGGRGSGAILFHAFPQEVILAIAKRNGGVASRVALPDTRGKSIQTGPEGRVFLLEELEDGGLREQFIFQFKDGQFFFD